MQKQLANLNKLFEDAFGSTPLGPAYCWKHTTDPGMDTLIHSGSSQVKLPSGIYALMPQYRRVSNVPVYGRKWMLAKWFPAQALLDLGRTDLTPDKQIAEAQDRSHDPERVWTDKYGASLPYPAKGTYMFVETISLDPGVQPDEEWTRLAIHCIREHLKKTLQDRIDEGNVREEEKQAAARARVGEEIDEVLPDFEPGSKAEPREIFTERFHEHPITEGSPGVHLSAADHGRAALGNV